MKTRQFGDFQTPLDLTRKIVKILGPIGEQWSRVLEPTCGSGNFIRAILESESKPREIVGIEIQKRYMDELSKLSNPLVKIINGDFFQIDLMKDIAWKSSGALLIIGNPPWVTNSEIGSINGDNLPFKTNFKGLRGIDAITGHSNFDIAEYIWIKLLNEFSGSDATIALLCKKSVARNVLKYANQVMLPISDAELRPVDAKKYFGAAVSACLFSLKTCASTPSYRAGIFGSLEDTHTTANICFVKGKPVSDLNQYESVSFLDGSSPFEWRQGIKHDAASVLELDVRSEGWFNALGERVDVESEYVYPLLKGSDVQAYDGKKPILRAVIIPQTEIGQNTRHLESVAPKLWTYLCNHHEIFSKRRSSIYKNKPPFSVFGLGSYSFSKFKVLVSGLHKKPVFIAVSLYESKPVFCDDTCYLLPCDSALQAAGIAAILNHPLARKFIRSITFIDAKRQITKSVLQRIDLIELANRISMQEIQTELISLLEDLTNLEIDKSQLPTRITDAIYYEYEPQQRSLY